MKSIDKRLIIGTVLGLGLGAWFLSSIQWSELFVVLRRVNTGWLVASAIVVFFGEWVTRGFRWNVLLRHIDPQSPVGPAISGMLVGAALNMIIPLRGGDFVRPAVVAKKRNLPYTLVFSTTIVERGVDIVGMLGVLAAMLYTMPNTSEDPLVADLQWWGTVFAVGAVSLVAFTLILGTGAARKAFDRFLTPLPTVVSTRVLRTFDELVAGLAVTGHPGRVGLAVLITGIVWTSMYYSVLFLFWAFDLQLPGAAGWFVAAIISLSIAVPQAPGYLGVFHVAIEKSLTLWDAPVAEAQACALVFWAINFIPVTVVGLAEGWRVGIRSLSDRSQLIEELEQRTTVEV